MLIVRKNQLFDQEWQVCQYINGEFVGIVSGMGRNADSTAKSKRTAQRWAKQCRRDDPKSTYRVETVN